MLGVALMEKFYLSEKTITDSYNSLTSINVKRYSELFSLLILKHAGMSQHDYLDLSKDSSKREFLVATQMLSYLFISNDYIKVNYNFINPLSMNKWGNNTKESVRQWSKIGRASCREREEF